MRLRAEHVAAAVACVQLMQKALDRMNIKLHDVISSLAGVSGMGVIRAIVAGERSPEALVALCDVQIRRKKGTGRHRIAAWHLGRRAYLRPRPGIAILEPLPETHRRLRQAHHCGTATA